MEFLNKTDFKGIIAIGIMSRLEGDADVNLNEAEDLAISELDPLRSKFNIDAELNKADDNRNKVLVRIMVHITAYYLYNSVPDDEIPDRIVDNWKKELKTIADIASGKLSSTLEALTGNDGEKVTTFRWGSNKKRAHELYPKTYPAE